MHRVDEGRTVSAQTVEAPEEVAEDWADNPSRMLHALCPYCYPTDPPVGTPTVRWCGQVVTIKGDAPIVTHAAPPDACVICAELECCATCGARRTFFGIMPPPHA